MKSFTDLRIQKQHTLFEVAEVPVLNQGSDRELISGISSADLAHHVLAISKRILVY